MTGISKLWRLHFWAAAAFNFIIGGFGLIGGPGSNERVVGLLVFCFGIIYALVAREPKRFAPALWAGVLGKLGVVVILLPGVLAGTAQPGLGAILAGDALFTLGFLGFLIRHGNRANLN